jgi:hypothetical protein
MLVTYSFTGDINLCHFCLPDVARTFKGSFSFDVDTLVDTRPDDPQIGLYETGQPLIWEYGPFTYVDNNAKIWIHNDQINAGIKDKFFIEAEASYIELTDCQGDWVVNDKVPDSMLSLRDFCYPFEPVRLTGDNGLQFIGGLTSLDRVEVSEPSVVALLLLALVTAVIVNRKGVCEYYHKR